LNVAKTEYELYVFLFIPCYKFGVK